MSRHFDVDQFFSYVEKHRDWNAQINPESNTIIAFDGYKTATVPAPVNWQSARDWAETITAIDKKFKDLWREGALRGVKNG